jgi:demethylmenaquinone methyltransferase / 2-methoxy-6-polyprenyl-1,4-benzoquinol methylase
MSSPHPLQSYYSRINKTYDLVNRLFTFGQDRRWRRHTTEACLANQPGKILDLCCGTGDLAISLARMATYPVSVTGYDLNAGMLEIARLKSSRSGLHEIAFTQGDAGSMPFQDEEFDCITIGFGFRNLTFENPNRDHYLREISRVMKPGSRLLILESARPHNLMVSFFYRLYLKLVLVPLGGLLSGDWSAYRYLAGSSAGFYSLDELAGMLIPYRLSLRVERQYLFGAVNLLIVTKKGT